MTKEEILEEHLTGHYIIADKIPASEVDDFRKSILEAMDKYARQQVNHFVSAPVSKWADDVINYIETDAEIAMPIDELFNEDGTRQSKKQYGKTLLKYLVKELREHFC